MSPNKEDLLSIIKSSKMSKYFEKNVGKLAECLLNRCYVVFHKNKILGVYPKWDYTVESIENIFKDEPFKDEISITMYYKAVSNEKDKIWLQ